MQQDEQIVNVWCFPFIPFYFIAYTIKSTLVTFISGPYVTNRRQDGNENAKTRPYNRNRKTTKNYID